MRSRKGAISFDKSRKCVLNLTEAGDQKVGGGF